MAALALMSTLAGCAAGCGSGSDEITFTCTNAGTGQQICAANSGPSFEGGAEPTPTPGR